MESLWSDTVNLPRFNSLRKEVKTDVLIIGGGITGILCAHMLKQAGIDNVLLEAAAVGGGITKNTTAKITAQHGLIYDKLIKDVGKVRASGYLQANLWAVQKFRSLCEGIDCDFEEKDAYVYSLYDMQSIQSEIEALSTLGYSAEFLQELPLPFSVAGAVRFPEQAQFHPLKFINAIAKDLCIYENTPVRELDNQRAVTDFGAVTAEKIIVATHFPFLNKHGSYFLKMFQERSYVIALENAANVKGMYINSVKYGISLRNFKNLLLVGGGGHRTGKTGGGFLELQQFAKDYFPKAREKYRWATQDCMTLDNIPYIGPYSRSTVKNAPKLYAATGYNKWGMTTSMAAAHILTDMVQGRDNPYAEVFSPSRSMLKKQLLVNGLEAVKNLATIKKPRCPHLGCALKWNRIQRTWDCPCHGSRFSENGELIDNPATKNLHIKYH